MNSAQDYLYAEFILNDNIFNEDIGKITYKIYKKDVQDFHYIIRRVYHLNIGHYDEDEIDVEKDKLVDVIKMLDKFLPFDISIKGF